MTSNLKDLVHSSFYITYNLGISPSEVDRLSTYEMREYMNLTRKKRNSEVEKESGILKSFMKILGLSKR